MKNDKVVERGIILAGLLVLGNFWCVRNLGQGLENYRELSGVVVLVTGSFGLISWLSRNAEEKKTSATIRRRLVQIFSFPLLATLAAVLLVFMFATSSVLVLNDFGETSTRILLTPADSKGAAAVGDAYKKDHPQDLENAIKDVGCAARPPNQTTEEATSTESALSQSIKELDRSKEDPYRFIVATSPFGRFYRLRVKGYQAKILEVFPMWGSTVSPGRDLRHAPSILLRPDIDALSELQEGGFIFVTLFRGGHDELIACGASKRSSFLLGAIEGIPLSNIQKYREEWRLELAEAKEDEKHTAQTLLEWKNATHMSLLNVPDLEPQMTLHIEVRSRNGNPVARTSVKLLEDDLVDALVPSLFLGKKVLASGPLASGPR